MLNARKTALWRRLAWSGVLAIGLIGLSAPSYAQYAVSWHQIGGKFRVAATRAGTPNAPQCVHGLGCNCPGQRNYCGNYSNGAKVQFWKDGCNRPPMTIQCVITPTAAPPQPAAASGCPAPGAVRSANSAQKSTLEFQNRSGRKVTIYWLDYNGQRKQYAELAPGKNYTQNTYATHPWIAVDGAGRCIGGVFRANSGRNTFQIM